MGLALQIDMVNQLLIGRIYQNMQMKKDLILEQNNKMDLIKYV